MKIRIKKLVSVSLALTHIFLATSCATVSNLPTGPTISRKDIEAKTPNRPMIALANRKEIISKIERFESALEKRGKALTPADWRLHDELLAKYIQLKNQSVNGTKILVPGRSRLRVEAQSFCLNSGRAAPSENEIFEWVKSDPKIPYYKEILKLFSKDKQIEQADIQALFWNLQNKTQWENYPDNFKAILQKIDPNAAVKLPSKIKDTAQNAVMDYLKSQMPIADKIDEAFSFAEGEYYRYSEYARSISDLKSKFSIEEKDEAQSIADSPLYVTTKSDGYHNQTLTFYNPTSKSQEIDLSDYYLKSSRNDVQRIALGRKPSVDEDLVSQLENSLYKSMARLGVGFTPVIGDVADLYELLTGKDFLNAYKLTWGERLLSGIGLIAGSGAGFRYAARAANAPEEFLPKFERGFEQVAKKELGLTSRELKETREFIAEAKSAKQSIEASPTLRKSFESNGFKKTDFYVRPNGEVIPSTGYRYISSDAQYLEDLSRIGKIPAFESGNYISFNKFDRPKSAADHLQLPPQNNASIRVEFDTAPIAERLQIPNGNYGRADYLEPITKDFPDFGKGGGYQAITKDSIQAKRIVDLRTNKVIFERGIK
ncbi:MAG: pre-toxin TG domain-containing protein [Bdellovibrionales bacterium]|nr:pre-toxin TG domain-containing protein [Bdellovibrionales bacterium]